MQSDASTSKTSLLSCLATFQKQDNFPRDAVHPFSSNASKTCNLLQDLINTTEQISNSLRTYDASGQWTNAKLVSLLRQHAAIENTSHSVVKGVQHLIESLRAHSGVSYGENMPLLRTSVPEWCIEQLVAWGASLGMQAARDDSREGGLAVFLAGQVLVIDVDFAIEHDDPLLPKLVVANVKTSNALAGNSNSNTSTLLDHFLADGLRNYCEELQKNEELRDSQHAAALRRRMVEHLRYLMVLDGLASRKEGGGIRWFNNVDNLCPTLNDLAKAEAQAIAASLSSPKAPLDIFLLRSHSLPLPYLRVPSISFLVHVSPSAYLSLRNSTNLKQPPTTQASPVLDISLADLKKGLTTVTNGVTICTLRLQQLLGVRLYSGSMSMPNVTSRPTFPLSTFASEFDHIFPQINAFGIVTNPLGLGSSSSEPPFAWILDFTEGENRRGVVMSQSRMKAIELVLNPLGVGSDLNSLGELVSLGSWIDFLLNPENPSPSERYATLYKSPNSLHPPLQLRLAAPEEPGYILESVPVHSMKEIWGILEIVREQCWLNETLLSCNWTPEALKSDEEDLPDTVQATEDGLQAVLAGAFTPRKIPVNVFLPSSNESDDLFGADLDFSPGTRPKIVMTCPERPPISGLIEITIAYDEKKPRGVSVSIQGAVGLDINASNLEEVCRRGGTWGLPGRIWTSGHGYS